MNHQADPSFETGATSAAANNLVLSVLNNGDVYKYRLHCGFDMLQGSSHRVSFKDIVTYEANKQRKQGSKFKPQEITEATKLIQADTILHCIELIKDNTNGVISASCRRWFDKVNGNSYFSVRIKFPNIDNKGNVTFKWITIPFQYGYGDQWKYEVINLLAKYSFIPPLKKYDNGNTAYGYLSDYERNGIVHWNDEGYGLKRNMYDGIYL